MDFASVVHSLLTWVIMAPYVLVGPMWLFSTTFFVLMPMAGRWLRAKWEGREIPKSRLKDGVWTIHGRKYDLTSYADQHPGGAWALQLGRNRDCTGLFESYHVMADMSKLEKIMARYELPESKTQNIEKDPRGNSTGLVFRDAFHQDVKQMARDYFKEKGISHKMKWWTFICVLLTISAEFASAVLVLYGYRVGLVLMPFFGWLLTGNVAHEASHFALSKRPWVNSLFAASSAPMFFNSTGWYIQHIVQHHVYTNDEDDVDLYHFLPVCRTSRLSEYVPQFAFQWLTVWIALPTSVCHLLLVVPMDLLTGYMDPVTKTRRYEQCENVDDLVAGAKTSIIGEMLLTIIYPLLVWYTQGFAQGCFWLSVSYSMASMYFIVFTQGAHLQEECMVGKESEDYSWAKRQVNTSLNFESDSNFWALASGGLNIQSIHHILPPISACHLRDMYPRFRAVCEKHGVKLKEAPGGICGFFRGFLSWVATLSVEDPSALNESASAVTAKAAASKVKAN